MNGPRSTTTGAADMRLNATALSPLMVNEREAVRITGLSARTLFTLRKTGQLPFIRVQSAIRYSLADLQDFIARNRHGGTP